jgi:hypothetical protein
VSDENADTSPPTPETIVRAKRLGWDEVLTPEQEFDMEPYAEKGYESDDIEGELEVIEVDTIPGVPAFKSYLVGGHEADPKTIRPVQGPSAGFPPQRGGRQ